MELRPRRSFFYLHTMKDLFSGQADSYAKYRPTYPDELFAFLLHQVNGREQAWDCATGNGQTALVLARHFTRVQATDISEQQLAKAPRLPNISYTLQPAEKTGFANDSFDLVTVSQALHWFDFDRFYPEVRRVTRSGGWLAAWMYGGLTINEPIDALKKQLHDETLGPYWDRARKFVNDNYANIPFPLEEIACPAFHITYDWTLEQLKGYLNTWSALQAFIRIHQFNPVDELMQRIAAYWTGTTMQVRFPLFLRMGRIIK